MVLSLLISPAYAFADECPAGGEHDFHVELLRYATSDTDGLRSYTCTKCGFYVEQVIPSTGHEWSDWYVTIEPTCTSEGMEERVCTKHPEEPHYEYQILPMLSSAGEHTWVESSRIDASCTTDGSANYYCSVCGKTKTEAIPATGHLWSDWQTVREATATTVGLEQSTCSLCGAIQTQEIPLLLQDDTEINEGNGSEDGDKNNNGDVEDAPAPSGLQRLIAKDFFTAGPGAADHVMHIIDLSILALARLAVIPMLGRVRWADEKRRQAIIAYRNNVDAKSQ